MTERLQQVLRRALPPTEKLDIEVELVLCFNTEPCCSGCGFARLGFVIFVMFAFDGSCLFFDATVLGKFIVDDIIVFLLMLVPAAA